VTLYQGVTLGGTSWNKGKRHPSLGNGVVIGAGAKVLGPFNVGENAKIGSNAVVTKEVPAGATVVGIPGQIVLKAVETKVDVDESKRRKIEESFGFDAYGLSEEMPDPVARSIRSMLDHMHLVDERMNSMCKELRKLDASYQKEDVPSLDDKDLDCFKEAN
jgi:serine O-acetyltransferase